MSTLMGTVIRETEFTALPVNTVIRSESDLVSVKLSDNMWAQLGRNLPTTDRQLADSKVIWTIIYLPEVEEVEEDDE